MWFGSHLTTLNWTRSIVEIVVSRSFSAWYPDPGALARHADGGWFSFCLDALIGYALYVSADGLKLINFPLACFGLTVWNPWFYAEKALQSMQFWHQKRIAECRSLITATYRVSMSGTRCAFVLLFYQISCLCREKRYFCKKKCLILIFLNIFFVWAGHYWYLTLLWWLLLFKCFTLYPYFYKR